MRTRSGDRLQDVAEPLDPVAASGLPLTVGDAEGEHEAARPEHDWPGSFFVWLSNAGAVGGALMAVVFFLDAVGVLEVPIFEVSTGRGLWIAGSCALSAVLGRMLAKGVSGFTRWGWSGAMGSLALGITTEFPLDTEPLDLGFSVLVIVMMLSWMRYFWNRRADFDIDLDF